MAEIEIRYIQSENDPLLNDVIELGDNNSATLGFLPEKSFEDYAKKKTIIIALINNHLAGYILYRIVKRRNHVRIAHMCVHENYRGKQVTAELFNELVKITKDYHGIGLNCREDYTSANQLWERLGFHPTKHKPGRGKDSTLINWWYSHEHKTLFDYDFTDRIKVVIDANIFFDLHSDNIEEESGSLQSDWIKDEISLLVTPELQNEISRKENPIQRTKNLDIAKSYMQTHADKNQFEDICSKTTDLFEEERRSLFKESDLKQIAWAIADPDVGFFVTKDKGILRRADIIYREFGLQVYNPTELILHIDELYQIDQYRRTSLAGITSIKQGRINTRYKKDVIEYFYNDNEQEKKAQFKKLLESYITRKNCECIVINDQTETPLIFYVLDRTSKKRLYIPILRYNKGKLDRILLRYLILSFQMMVAQEGQNLIQITDEKLQNATKEILYEDYFVPTGSSWVKVNLLIMDEAIKIGQKIKSIIDDNSDLEPGMNFYTNLLLHSNASIELNTAIELEKRFWPAKITDHPIQTLTAPIKSVWASLWFDYNLASQTLFGADEGKAFNREGVYYSGKRLKNIISPARILWYVSHDPKAVGSKAIRACSRVDDILIGKPKDLYRRFQHLGIYEWRDVFDVAGKDIDKEIMAIIFSDTELFLNPVSLNMWEEMIGKTPAIYSPSPISKDVFENLYQIGMGLNI